MTLLAAEKISKKFNDQLIFEQISFTVLNTDKIGLVGKNGSGKTTLFEILTNQMESDSGTISKSKSCRIDYAEQEKDNALTLTLFEYVASARPDLTELRHTLSRLEETLAKYPEDLDALNRLGTAHNEYEHLGGFQFDNEIKTILTGLGFMNERWQDTLNRFSGGEKNRASLARLLAGNGNLMLLDEPTNHLDIESTKWLEEFLQKTDKAFIVVSHDRAFLQNCVAKVWELLNGRFDFYVGNCESFLMNVNGSTPTTTNTSRNGSNSWRILSGGIWRDKKPNRRNPNSNSSPVSNDSLPPNPTPPDRASMSAPPAARIIMSSRSKK